MLLFLDWVLLQEIYHTFSYYVPLTHSHQLVSIDRTLVSAGAGWSGDWVLQEGVTCVRR